MADSVIGALRVLLGLDTAAFSSGAKDAQKSLGGLDGAIRAATGGLTGLKGVLGAVSAGAFVAFLKNSVKLGEEIEKGAKRTGLSVEAFQEYSYAAALAGVSQEELTKSLDKFNKGLGGNEEQVGATEKALGRLGLRLDEIKKLEPSERLKVVSDRLANLSDVTERASIGTDLFGRGFGNVSAVLAGGRTEIQKTADEAHKLGMILSDETVKKAGEADDEFDRLGRAFKVAGVQIAAEFLPAITAVRVVFTSPDFQDGVKNVAKYIGDFVKFLAENQNVVAAAAAGFAAFRTASMIAGPLAGAAAGATAFYVTLQQVETQTQKATQELSLVQGELYKTKKAIKDLNDEYFSGKGPEDYEARLVALMDDQARYQNGVDTLNQKIKDLNATHILISKKQEDEGSGNIFDPTRYKKISDAIDKINLTIAENTGKLGGFTPEVVQAGIALDVFKVNAEGVIVPVDGLRNGIDKLVDAHERLRKTTAQGVLTKFTNDLSNAGKMVGDFAVNSLNQMASSLADVVTGAKSAADAWKDFAKAIIKALAEMLIKMLIVLPIAEALKAAIGGPLALIPLPFAGGGSFVVGGGQGGIGHAATGASYLVPGGSMGVDTKLVPLALSPGEQVDITPASQVGAGGDKYLLIPAIDPRDFFTGDTVRHMVASIDQWMRDGGTGIKMVPSR